MLVVVSSTYSALAPVSEGIQQSQPQRRQSLCSFLPSMSKELSVSTSFSGTALATPGTINLPRRTFAGSKSSDINSVTLCRLIMFANETLMQGFRTVVVVLLSATYFVSTALLPFLVCVHCLQPFREQVAISSSHRLIFWQNFGIEVDKDDNKGIMVLQLHRTSRPN